MPELYPDAVEGPYTVPSDTDIADGPQAFRDFADSLGGLSDTLEVIDFTGDKTITPVEMGALFTLSDDFSGMVEVLPDEHPVGSVFVVANISDVADVVVGVETPNLSEVVGQYAIMSFTQVQPNVWVPNGGGATGGGDEGGVAAKMLGRGGTESFLFVDINGQPVLHALHEFKTTGANTFTQIADGDIEYLIVGGGGNGGGYAGGGGGGVMHGTMTLPAMADPDVPTDHTLTVGGATQTSTAFGVTAGQGGNNQAGGGANGGSGGGGNNIQGPGNNYNNGGSGNTDGTYGGNNGGRGGESSDFGGNGGGGGGGGAGGVGGNYGYRGGGGGGQGVTLDITGVNITYARGGDGASPNESGQGLRSPEANTGGGGSGRAVGGAAGVIVLRYPVETLPEATVKMVPQRVWSKRNG